MTEMKEQRYVGFWLRVVASIVDTFLATLIIAPLLSLVFGSGESAGLDLIANGSADAQMRILLGQAFSTNNLVQSLLQLVLAAIAIILFWISRSATPGKMMIGAEIVDTRTGGKPTTGQFIGRYFAYYVSMIPFFLGFIWVAFDKRKQGWHDKLAGTVVVHKRR